VNNQTIIFDQEKNVTLTPYVLECGNEFRYTKKRPAVLVLPGGGYQFCSNREAEPVALAFNHAGYHAFVLRYSVQQNATWPNPLNDYEQAIATIRARAEEWNVIPDQIAVCGFSAGGHLASAAATLAKNKPNAAILGYAVTLERTLGHLSTPFPDTAKAVSPETPPCFIFATRTDELVPSENSLRFALAMDEAGLDYELHIYAYGGHGYSLGTFEMIGPSGDHYCSRAKNWVEDSIAWLDELFTGKALSFKNTGRALDRRAEFLSMDNTIGRMLEIPAARKLLDEKMPGLSTSPHMAVVWGLTLRYAISMGNMPKSVIAELEESLKKIPNSRG